MHLCGWEGVQVYVVFTHACVVSVDMCCVLLCEVCIYTCLHGGIFVGVVYLVCL